MWNAINWLHIGAVRVQKWNGGGREKIFKERMTEKFPQLKKTINSDIQ